MEGRKNEIQVGIITIFSLAVLIVGMMWFKQVSVNAGVNHYHVDFRTVEGLMIGDRIQVRGIRTGQVEGYEIMADFVRVDISVDESVSLSQDAKVTLGTKGIVGEVVIEIAPGTGPTVEDAHIFQGRTAASIAEMTDAAGTALQAFQSLTTKLDSLMLDIQQSGRVVETLAASHDAVTNLNAMMAENREATANFMANLQTASEALAELMESGTVERAFGDFSSAASRADSLMLALESSAVHLETILTKVDEGDGTAALLLNDPALYQQTHATMESMQRLMDEIRRNPKKYFNVNVF